MAKWPYLLTISNNWLGFGSFWYSEWILHTLPESNQKVTFENVSRYKKEPFGTTSQPHYGYINTLSALYYKSSHTLIHACTCCSLPFQKLVRLMGQAASAWCPLQWLSLQTICYYWAIILIRIGTKYFSGGDKVVLAILILTILLCSADTQTHPGPQVVTNNGKICVQC